MKIRIISDLHLEFFKWGYPNWLDYENDILILAGDITIGPKKLQDILHRFADVSRHVIYVFGNHEYYGYNLSSYDDIHVPSNVHILNPGTISIDGVTFTGATLWTDFRGDSGAAVVATKYITDFKRIRNFNTDTAKKLHAEQTAYINNNPSDIVITHFLPNPSCIAREWEEKAKYDQIVDKLNYYFAGSAQVATPKYWIFGHTHSPISFIRENTAFIANPHGYEGYENTSKFNPKLEINL